jgi:hypothetical protein
MKAEGANTLVLVVIIVVIVSLIVCRKGSGRSESGGRANGLLETESAHGGADRAAEDSDDGSDDGPGKGTNL